MSDEERNDSERSESETSIESKINRTPATRLSVELSQEKSSKTSEEE